MRLGDRLTNALNRCEAWIEDRRRPLLLSPVRLAATFGLFALVLVLNLLALARWPFSAASRIATSRSNQASGEPVPVDAAKLEQLIAGGDAVLVDFWAEWCGPCLLMNGVLKDVAKHLQGQVTVAKVDSTLHPGLTSEYRVAGLPTLVLLKNGNEVARHVGSLGFEDLVAFVEHSDAEASARTEDRS